MTPVDAPFLNNLANSGGYAVLLGVVLLAVFYLARQQLESQAERATVREERIHAEAKRAIEREARMSEEYKAITERMIDVVERNTSAHSVTLEVLRTITDQMARLDAHLSKTP